MKVVKEGWLPVIFAGHQRFKNSWHPLVHLCTCCVNDGFYNVHPTVRSSIGAYTSSTLSVGTCDSTLFVRDCAILSIPFKTAGSKAAYSRQNMSNMASTNFSNKMYLQRESVFLYSRCLSVVCLCVLYQLLDIAIKIFKGSVFFSIEFPLVNMSRIVWIGIFSKLCLLV